MPRRRIKRVKKKFAAFTLIELLIVIVVIGIMATLALAAFNVAAKKSRDSKRISDLKAFKQTMEVAKLDCTTQSDYPVYPGTTSGSGNSRFNNMITGLNNAGYKIPTLKDPLDTNQNQYIFMFQTTPTTALICMQVAGGTANLAGRLHWVAQVQLESDNNPTAVQSFFNCQNTAELYLGAVTVTNRFYVCSET